MGGRHKPSNKQLKQAAVEKGEDPDDVTVGTGTADVKPHGTTTGGEDGGKRNKVLDEGGNLKNANKEEAKKAKEVRPFLLVYLDRTSAHAGRRC